jgi:hypothetical protein
MRARFRLARADWLFMAVFNSAWMFSVQFNGAAVATMLGFSSPAPSMNFDHEHLHLRQVQV